LAPLRRTLPKVLVKHLFPTRSVYTDGIGNHAVEVEQNGVILVARDRRFAVAAASLSICALIACPTR
jgi:hypothetical protein